MCQIGRQVVKDLQEALDKGRQTLAKANRIWASRAPLLVVGYSRREDDCVLGDGRAYHQFDLGMSVMNMILAATRHRLLARPMAGFDPSGVRGLFGLNEEDEPLVIVAFGYPSADDGHLPERYRSMDKKTRERKEASAIAVRL